MLLAKLRVAPGSFGPVRIVPGTRIGRYRIAGEVERGCSGEVYLAFDLRGRRMVALRTLSEASVEAKGRFVRDARVIAGLRHPAIEVVHDAGLHEGIAFASSELVEGETLAERLSAGGSLEPRAAAALVRALADGVQAAHGARIVHGMVEPAKVIIDASDRPRLACFGLARVAWSNVGSRIDVQGLGAVLHEALTGRPPSRSRAPRPALTTAPRDLGVICTRALEKDARRRYPSARALAADLDCFLAEEPIAALKPSLVGRVARVVFGRE